MVQVRTDCALRVAAPLKDTAFSVSQWDHVTRASKVIWTASVIGKLERSGCAIGCTDASCDAMFCAGVNGDGVCSLVTLLVVRHHHGYFQSFQAGRRKRNTDVSAGTM